MKQFLCYKFMYFNFLMTLASQPLREFKIDHKMDFLTVASCFNGSAQPYISQSTNINLQNVSLTTPYTLNSAELLITSFEWPVGFKIYRYKMMVHQFACLPRCCSVMGKCAYCLIRN